MGASINPRLAYPPPPQGSHHEKRKKTNGAPAPATGVKGVLVLLALLVVLWVCWRYFGLDILDLASSAGREPEKPGSVTITSSDPEGVSNFAKFRDGEWVAGSGTVKMVLVDDTTPPRHQRFILKDPFGHTILVAHNIDQSERLRSLKEGDVVDFSGEFIDNDRGGLVHWTHPDLTGRRKGGFVRKR